MTEHLGGFDSVDDLVDWQMKHSDAAQTHKGTKTPIITVPTIQAAETPNKPAPKPAPSMTMRQLAEWGIGWFI